MAIGEDAAFLGSTGGSRLNRPVVALARSTSGPGYHLVGADGGYRLCVRDGGMFGFGVATHWGSLAASPLSSPIVGCRRRDVTS